MDNLEPKQRQWLAWMIVAIVLTLVSIFFGVTYPVPAPPDPVQQLGTTNFDTLELSEDLSVGDDATITDDAAIGGDATVTGALEVTGNTTLSGILYPSSADLTISVAGQAVTPTTTAIHLDSAGAISMTLAACVPDGQMLWLYGDDANTITINDTNIRSTDGNAVTIGQYDVVGFMCMDTEWNHVAKSANS